MGSSSKWERWECVLGWPEGGGAQGEAQGAAGRGIGTGTEIESHAMALPLFEWDTI